MNNFLSDLLRYRRRTRRTLFFRTVQLVVQRVSSSCQSFSHRQFRNSWVNWKVVGVILGTFLFFGIVSHTDPVSAQLFETVESQVETIFGTNIDATIISFMFGILRIVIWVTAVGFIFFAVYQAQRGEQWQPLIQNAFIVIAAVVIVEGMSQLFFGGATG